MQTDPEITIACDPINNKGKVRVTVRRRDEVLFADQVQIDRVDSRRKLIKAVCEAVPALDETDLEHQLLQSVATLGSGADATSGEDDDASDLLAAMPQDVRDEADEMRADPSLIQIIIEDIAALGVAGEANLTATIYLLGTSRLLDRPLAAIIQGPSSSGKSYPLENIAKLFPDETRILATDLSPQALYYMEPGSLVHRFVVGGERSRRTDPEAQESTKALRQMLSEQRLDKQVVITEGGRPRTVHLRQDGPIAFIETTTHQKIFAEDQNRAILLHTDERESQTRRIIERIGDTHSGLADAPDAAGIIDRHHALQRSLRPLPIAIPFAPEIAKHFPASRVEARRAIDQVLAMVGASALLHQQQRVTDHRGHLIARREDYDLARRLLDEPMARLLGRCVSAAALRLCERLREKWASETFTVMDVVQQDELRETSIRGYLIELYEAGHLELVEEKSGPKPRKYQLAPEPPMEQTFSALPSAEIVFSGLRYGGEDKEQVHAQATVGSALIETADKVTTRSPHLFSE